MSNESIISTKLQSTAWTIVAECGVPPAAIQQCQAKSGIDLFPKIILINKFLAEADPEIELLVPTFLGNDPRRFYGRGVPKTMSQKFESSI